LLRPLSHAPWTAMGVAEPARPWAGTAWRAGVHEIAWAAVQRGGGEHADLEWLPAVIEARLAHRVDLLERAGATEEELAAARDELVMWAAELLSAQQPRRKRGGLSRSAWPARLR
jgi:hypothetical protein